MSQRLISACPLSRRALVAGSLTAAATLAGCSLGDQGAADDVVPAVSMDVATERPQVLDPGAADAAGLQVDFQVFDPLTEYDYELGEVIGRAASRFDVSDDARTFTFLLRDAVFSNGEQVTSESFKRAWERIVDPSSALNQHYGPSPHARRLVLVEGFSALAAGDTHSLTGLSCPDSRTLVVRLSAPYADFPILAAHPALAPVPQDAEDDVESFGRAPVGNGAYAVASEVQPKTPVIHLASDSGYILGAPQIEHVYLSIQDDSVDAYQAFSAGELDVSPCPMDDLAGAVSSLGSAPDGLVMGEDGHVVESTELACSLLQLNCGKAPFDDISLRRAASLAIDREAIADLYQGMAAPADGLLPPVACGYREASWIYAAYNLAAARDLMQPALDADDADERLAVSIIYLDEAGQQKVVETVAGMLEHVGFSCELEPLEQDDLDKRLASGDFTIARLDAVTDAPAAELFLGPWFDSGERGIENHGGYANDDVTALLDEARSTVDDAIRVERLQAADAHAGEDAPLIPLVWPRRAFAGVDDIQDLLIDPVGFLHLASARIDR